MKKTIIAICLSSLLYGFHCVSDAQGRQGQSTARDLYLNFEKTASKPAGSRRGRPGSKIKMELMRNNRLSLVTPQEELSDGDRIAFRMAVNYRGYLMVTNVGTSGNMNVLYSGQVSPTSDMRIPAKGWIRVTGKGGDEVVNFIMSSEPIQEVRQVSAPEAGPEAQKTLTQLNSRALDQGRDLVIENDGEDTYALAASAQRIRTPIGFSIKLKHR
jgi:molybdopterin converting factor small subunit